MAEASTDNSRLRLSLTDLPISGIVLVVSLLCGYVIAQYLYLLFFHPLVEHPGPKVCAVSRIPYWLATTQGRDVQWLYKLHKKYGPVVRFGPTDLSYATAQAWKDIHGYSKGRPENGKAPEFSVQPANGTKDGDLLQIVADLSRCCKYAECHFRKSCESPPAFLTSLL